MTSLYRVCVCGVSLTDGCLWPCSATLCCMGGALWVLIANYGSGTPNAWPGVALLLQTILVTVAGFLFFFGRGKGGGYGEL